MADLRSSRWLFCITEAVARSTKATNPKTSRYAARNNDARIHEPQSDAPESVAHLKVQPLFRIRWKATQALNGRIFRNLDEVRVVVAEFVESYNQHWRLEKLGYVSPVMARLAHVEGVAA